MVTIRTRRRGQGRSRRHRTREFVCLLGPLPFAARGVNRLRCSSALAIRCSRISNWRRTIAAASTTRGRRDRQQRKQATKDWWRASSRTLANLETEGNFKHTDRRAAHALRPPAPSSRSDRDGLDPQYRHPQGEIARPTVGLTTNIGPDHLEFFAVWEDRRRRGRATGSTADLAGRGAQCRRSLFDYLAHGSVQSGLVWGLSEKADVRAIESPSTPVTARPFDCSCPGSIVRTPSRSRCMARTTF